MSQDRQPQKCEVTPLTGTKDSVAGEWLSACPLNENKRKNLHPFQTPYGKQFLFDAQSNLFLELSELGYALMRLRLHPNDEAQAEAPALYEKYPASEIKECAKEAEQAMAFLLRRSQKH